MVAPRGPNNVTRTHSFSSSLSFLSSLNPVIVPAYLLRLTHLPDMVTGLSPNQSLWPGGCSVQIGHIWVLCPSLEPGVGIVPPKPRGTTVGQSCFPKDSLGVIIRTWRGKRKSGRQQQELITSDKTAELFFYLKIYSLHGSENLPVKPLGPGVFLRKRLLTMNSI